MLQLMKKLTPKVIKNLVRRFCAIFVWDPWLSYSWSQEGEDQILKRIFEKDTKGFYIDVGAHHPKRFSNTYLFYRAGWRGINIDAMPNSMRIFNKTRPRDINIECGVGEEAGCLDYYIFNEPALNGFSKEISNDRVNTIYTIEEIIKINVFRLSELLDCYLPEGQVINFLSVDVEGYDLQVLKSNNWLKYRPKFVLAEILNCEFHKLSDTEIGKFMRELSYYPYAKTVNTVFFKLDE